MSDASVLFGGGAAPLWVSGTTYAQGRVTISPTDWQTYVRKVAGAGSTDPASDATNWMPCGGRAIKSTQRGSISGAGTSTISAVNTAKTQLRWHGGAATATGAFADVPRLALTSSTTITSTGGGNSASVNWELTEWY